MHGTAIASRGIVLRSLPLLLLLVACGGGPATTPGSGPALGSEGGTAPPVANTPPMLAVCSADGLLLWENVDALTHERAPDVIHSATYCDSLAAGGGRLYAWSPDGSSSSGTLYAVDGRTAPRKLATIRSECTQLRYARSADLLFVGLDAYVGATLSEGATPKFHVPRGGLEHSFGCPRSLALDDFDHLLRDVDYSVFVYTGVGSAQGTWGSQNGAVSLDGGPFTTDGRHLFLVKGGSAQSPTIERYDLESFDGVPTASTSLPAKHVYGLAVRGDTLVVAVDKAVLAFDNAATMDEGTEPTATLPSAEYFDRLILTKTGRLIASSARGIWIVDDITTSSPKQFALYAGRPSAVAVVEGGG